jgi:amidase
MIVNVTNQPSVMVPIGRTAAGLPVGMQIIAPYLRDRRAIRVAEHLGGRRGLRSTAGLRVTIPG